MAGVCSVPGCPELTNHGRCPTHRAERERHQRATVPTKATRTHAEQRRRAAAVRRHRARHGNRCPGWHVPPHEATDLTADHIIAIAAGGQPAGQLQVLCRSCNARKADTPTSL
jgi:5-methylcytosine-specific restriction enzyme A